MIVMKFGGTSVGNIEAIRRVGKIIESRLERKPVVVVSAVSGITNKLVRLGQISADKNHVSAKEIIEEIRKVHAAIISELEIDDSTDIKKAFPEAIDYLTDLSDRLLRAGDLVKHLVDEMLSIGEFLSANIVSAYLRSIGIASQFADARELVSTDSRFGRAQVSREETQRNIKEKLIPVVSQGVPVIQGFIGRDSFGRTTTLGRGGSDYSATYIGALVDAEAVEIWSDVDGILTADPSLVPNAKRIRKMSFQEAAELAYFGAKVLHPATLLPAIEKDIPVYVLNSMRPEDSGTKISKSKDGNENNSGIVKSIAYKEGLIVITVTSSRMLMAHGFMSSIFEIFDRYQTSVDLVSTSEVSVSMTIDQVEHLEDIHRELVRFAQVSIEENKAIVSLVGEKMKSTPGMPAKIFGFMTDIPIHLISQGASEINISFVIDESNLPIVINRLHDRLFSGTLNPELFG